MRCLKTNRVLSTVSLLTVKNWKIFVNFFKTFFPNGYSNLCKKTFYPVHMYCLNDLNIEN